MASDGAKKQRLAGGIMSSPLLSTIAKKAYERSKSNAPGEKDAIVAVVFWAMFQEAFINEKIWYATTMVKNTPEAEAIYHKKLCEFARECKPMLKNITPTTTKYQEARRIFTGGTYDKEKSPLKDSQSLVGLRNWLVHMKVEEIRRDDSGRETVSRLPAIKWLEELKRIKPLPDALQSTPDHINTQAVAKWAKKTVRTMVQDFSESISNTLTRGLLHVDHDMSFFDE